jgi:hypothetical protein
MSSLLGLTAGVRITLAWLASLDPRRLRVRSSRNPREKSEIRDRVCKSNDRLRKRRRSYLILGETPTDVSASGLQAASL